MRSDTASAASSSAWWEASWQPDPEIIAALASLAPGDQVMVAKWDPNGFEVTRYPATVAPVRPLDPWIEVVATWTHGAVDVAGLEFRDGDTIREFFSPWHPFNAFMVIAPDGIQRGWYGNVTYPAFVIEEGGNLTIVWHDLYLDVVILPDGSTHLLDDDELDECGLASTDPVLHRAIVQARHDLLIALSTPFD